MIGLIVWIVIVLFASNALPGWGWWFWALTFVIPPLILLPIIQAVAP